MLLKQARYDLTVNAWSREDIRQIEEALALKAETSGKKLKLVSCFGPNKMDGSYLAMFSSSGLGIAGDGFVPAWPKKACSKFFYQLRDAHPDVKLTLKWENFEDGEKHRQVFRRREAVGRA